jgi:hypothetical protein
MSKRKAKHQHVVPHDGKWAVRGEGNQRVTSTHGTQREAIEAAREIAKNNYSELVVHGSDGRIRDRDHYGRDPYPPKDRKVLDPVTPSVTKVKKIKEAVDEVIEESRMVN